MFDAAIGPRLEASSFRMRSVFSAAGTLEAGLAAGVLGTTAGASAGRVVVVMWSSSASAGVRYPVLKHASGWCQQGGSRSHPCLESQTILLPAGRKEAPRTEPPERAQRPSIPRRRPS